jgi:hypothetical protein
MKKLFLVICLFVGAKTYAQDEINLMLGFKVNTYNNSKNTPSQGDIKCSRFDLSSGETHTNSTGYNQSFFPVQVYNYSLIQLKRSGNLTGISGVFEFQEYNENERQWKNMCKVSVNAPFIGANSYQVTYYEGYGPDDNFAEGVLPRNSSGNKWKAADGLHVMEADYGGTFKSVTTDLGIGVAKREWRNQFANLPTKGVLTLTGKISIDKSTLLVAQGQNLATAIQNALKLKVLTYTKANYLKLADDRSAVVLGNIAEVGNISIENVNENDGTATYKITALPLIVLGFAYYQNDQAVGYPVSCTTCTYWNSVQNHANLLRYDVGGTKKEVKPFSSWVNYTVNNDAQNYLKVIRKNRAVTSPLMRYIDYIDVQTTGNLNIFVEEANTNIIDASSFTVNGPEFRLVGISEQQQTRLAAAQKFQPLKRFNPTVNPQQSIGKALQYISKVSINAVAPSKIATPTKRLIN